MKSAEEALVLLNEINDEPPTISLPFTLIRSLKSSRCGEV